MYVRDFNSKYFRFITESEWREAENKAGNTSAFAEVKKKEHIIQDCPNGFDWWYENNVKKP